MAKIVSIFCEGKRVDMPKDEFQKVLQKYGTSDGAKAGWDTRGRKQSSEEGTKAGGLTGREGEKAGGEVDQKEMDVIASNEKRAPSEVQRDRESAAKSFDTDGYDVNPEYYTMRNVNIAAQDGYTAEWTGSHQEVRISNPDKAIVITIPQHGKFIQLGSTVKNIKDLNTVLSLANSSREQVYGQGKK